MEHTDVGCSRLVLSEGDCVLSVNTNAGKCGVSLVTHIESRIVAVLYLEVPFLDFRCDDTDLVLDQY